MEDWEKLVPWMSELSGDEMTGDWVSELWDGVLLCQVINGIAPNKIKINMDFENDERAAISNLENFLWAAKELGVDKAHLFSLEGLEENPDPDAETLEGVRKCLASLKTIVEQRGTLEKQNIWRKDAAEVRAKQNNVRHNYHKKETKTLSDVTQAVRNFKASTNNDADLRYQKKGQQKWKLFETHHQREKGITLEESLQEIEEFERTGKVPESMKKKGVQRGIGGATQGFKGTLEMTLNKDKDGNVIDKSSATQNVTGGRQGSTVRTPGGMVSGGRPELTVKPQRGGGKGAAYFQQFNNKQNRKYKPGNDNGKKLW